MRRMKTVAAIVGLGAMLGAEQASTRKPVVIDVTVGEGTSMSVAVSPDGRTLAIDLQGSIWTVPAAGGAATRITDLFNDARQPDWSPDGKSIAFFAYRDGGYDLWAIAPDGSQSAQAHLGRVRRSRAGLVARRHARRVLVGPRQSAGQRLQHLDARHRATASFRQMTKDAVRRLHADAGRPTTREIAFASARDDGQSVWAVNVADGAERKVSSAGGTRGRAVVGPGGQIVYHVTVAGPEPLRGRRQAA